MKCKINVDYVTLISICLFDHQVTSMLYQLIFFLLGDRYSNAIYLIACPGLILYSVISHPV
jgi:hypothetical protein